MSIQIFNILGYKESITYHLKKKIMQSFLAGSAGSGVITSALRMITKASFEHTTNGLRIGACMFNTKYI